MQFHNLQRKTPNMKRMIVARGGKRGKTSGRGGKGQSARAGNKRRPEWRDIIKKLPKLRGRGVNQNKPVSLKPIVINVSIIEGAFAANEAITPTVLVEKGIVATMSGVIPMIKILGDGEITKALKFSGCYVSESAKAKIEKAGGSVTLPASRVIPKQKGPTHESDRAVVVEKKAAPAKETKKAGKGAKSNKKAADKKSEEKSA